MSSVYPVNMFRLIVLSVVLTVVLAETKYSEANRKCQRLGNLGDLRCCKTGLPMPKVDRTDLKECMEMPYVPHSCEQDICIAKKRGYGSDDGTVDKAAVEKIISQDFESAPTLVKAVKENCIDGNLDGYGTADDCELMKITRCVHMQAIFDCKEWSDDGPCAGIKDVAKECAKLLS